MAASLEVFVFISLYSMLSVLKIEILLCSCICVGIVSKFAPSDLTMLCLTIWSFGSSLLGNSLFGNDPNSLLLDGSS